MKIHSGSPDSLRNILARRSAEVDGISEVLSEVADRRFRGAPSVAVDAQGHLIQTLTAYLLSLRLERSSSLSERSVREYEGHLQDYWTWLQIQALDWTEVTTQHIAEYRNDMHLRRKLQPTTINSRLTAVQLFYRWAIEEETAAVQPGLRRWASSMRSQVEGDVRWRKPGSLHMRLKTQAPRVPSVAETSRVLADMPSPYGLMACWYAVTGLRRSELPRLLLEKLPDTTDGPLASIDFLRKGGYVLPVLVPAMLIERTNDYVKKERPKTAKKRASRRREPPNVFLNSRGNPASGQSVYLQLKRSAGKFGVKTTLHALRHYFAVQVYQQFRQMELNGKQINSLKLTQKLLGHRSIGTTERYLQSLPVPDEALDDALSSLLAGLEE